MDRLTAMETFVHVVESGSFSVAAKRLGIGQPSVSKSVAQLEAYLHVRLVLRSTRGMIPTEAGLAFYEQAKRAIDYANGAEDAARGAGADLSGNLRISAGVTLARMYVIPHLSSFLEQHPRLNVDVVLDDRILNLMEAGIDVALRIGKLNDSGLTARRIAQSPCRVFGTPAYFDRFGEPKTPTDILHHQTVIYSLADSARWTFTQGSQQQPVVTHGRLHVSSSEGIRAGVLAHQGLAMTAEWMFMPEMGRGEVKAVLNDWKLPPRELWAVTPTGRMASAKARAFISHMEKILNKSGDY